jgi:hypothetical protein
VGTPIDFMTIDVNVASTGVVQLAIIIAIALRGNVKTSSRIEGK